MRILVDADAFPDLEKVVSLAKKYYREIFIYIDSEHEIDLDAQIIQVSKGANAVDTVIENDVEKGDLVLTQDYGVAVIALAKGAKCIHPLGYSYTQDNINYLLEIKNQNRKLRKYVHLKGPKKRTREDTKNLLLEIEKVIQ